MNNLLHKYGNTALIAGASEGLGAAFASYLGAAGMNLVLVARRKEHLEIFAADLKTRFNIDVDCIWCDLADVRATEYLQEAIGKKEINMLVYNAALSHIGAFEKQSLESYMKTTQVNMITPMKLFHMFGEVMLTKGKGALIMMASLAGFQGSGFLTVYAATKAFDRVLAESLWYEWKDRVSMLLPVVQVLHPHPISLKQNQQRKLRRRPLHVGHQRRRDPRSDDLVMLLPRQSKSQSRQ